MAFEKSRWAIAHDSTRSGPEAACLMSGADVSDTTPADDDIASASRY